LEQVKYIVHMQPCNEHTKTQTFTVSVVAIHLSKELTTSELT